MEGGVTLKFISDMCDITLTTLTNFNTPDDYVEVSLHFHKFLNHTGKGASYKGLMLYCYSLKLAPHSITYLQNVLN